MAIAAPYWHSFDSLRQQRQAPTTSATLTEPKVADSTNCAKLWP